MDFEALCYSMYKSDGGVKVSELKKMSCVEFYMHKKHLTEHLRKQPRHRERD